MTNEFEARAALGSAPSGGTWELRELGDGFWHAIAVDEEGQPVLGAAHFVGPDKAKFTFSSNPLIHDSAVVLSTLKELYATGESPNQEEVSELARERTEQKRQGNASN